MKANLRVQFMEECKICTVKEDSISDHRPKLMKIFKVKENREKA